MSDQIIVVGGGGHARVVAEAASAAGFNLRGFTDNESRAGSGLGPYLGQDTVVADYPNDRLILGIGCVRADTKRGKIVARIGGNPARWAVVAHPSAIVSAHCLIEYGTVILAGAVVNIGAEIAAHCIINSQSVIEHDCRIATFTHVCPGAVIGGGTIVGSHCLIGLGSRVRNHIEIGNHTTVGMGAVVTKSHTAGGVLIGNPARPFEQQPQSRPSLAVSRL